MKRYSFFCKLVLGNLLIVMVVTGLAAALSFRSINEQHLRDLYAHQDCLAQVARQYLEHVWPLPTAEIDAICKAFGEVAPVYGPLVGDGLAGEHPPCARLTVIDADGRVLGDSLGNPSRMANHRTPDRPEIAEALAGRPGRHVRRSDTLGIEFRYVAQPIVSQDKVVGAVRVAMPAVAILQSQSVIRDALLWAAVVSVLAFALLAVLINWVWYAPLKRISHTARLIASGDLDQRASISGPAELVQLATALNAMRDSLARQIRTMTAQRENLSQVIANLNEGVVAVDANATVVFANRAAHDVLGLKDGEATGRPLAAVVRITAVLDAYAAATASGKPVDRQVETDLAGRRRHLNIHVHRLPGEPGDGIMGLIVFHDVTDLVRAAAMKTEFVANASHELRTPLATIRAAVDTIQHADPDDRQAIRQTVAILDRHVRRLEALTLDLLDLHAVESAQAGDAPETVSLESLRQWAEGLFADAAAAKGVTLEFVPSVATGNVVSNRRLLELILQNLLDNAMKFTSAGGRVTCSIENTPRGTILRVADTGCGIRPEDQPRVFERFFQADQARSGDTQTRGTGLGLAIVKHAADRLGAKVTLESQLGKGTTFTVVLPAGQGAEPAGSAVDR